MIPKHAKKVFHGNIFHIYQWEQELFDTTTKTFEVARKQDGVSVIASHQNKIIVLKQKQPNKGWYYSVPGGYMDIPGERPVDTAKRELLEETGMKPQTIKLWQDYTNASRMVSHHYIYIAKQCWPIAAQALDGGEIIKIEFLKWSEILSLVSRKNFHNRDIALEFYKAQAIKAYGNRLKQALFS